MSNNILCTNDVCHPLWDKKYDLENAEKYDNYDDIKDIFEVFDKRPDETEEEYPPLLG